MGAYTCSLRVGLVGLNGMDNFVHKGTNIQASFKDGNYRYTFKNFVHEWSTQFVRRLVTNEIGLSWWPMRNNNGYIVKDNKTD